MLWGEGAGVVSVGDNIAAARVARGMSRADLARAIGVKYPSVWRYENGKSTPRAPTLFRIAEALGTTVAGLMSDEGASHLVGSLCHRCDGWGVMGEGDPAHDLPPEPSRWEVQFEDSMGELGWWQFPDFESAKEWADEIEGARLYRLRPVRWRDDP